MTKLYSLTAMVGATMLFGFSMCNINAPFGTKGNGNVVEKLRDVPVFTKIETGGNIDVFIKQGDEQKVTVETDENLQDKVLTKVENDVLKLSLEKWELRSTRLRVNVTIKDLKGISASGAADVASEMPLVLGTLEINASGGSDINLDVKAIEINGSSSGGSDINLKGAAGYLNFSTSGGSDLKAFGLVVAKANVSASGGSDIYITVDEELSASASGGSDVKYRGPATVKKAETSGGANITKD